MRKEYHYTLSRTDRIYLIVFVLVLLSWELIKYVLPPIAITRIIPGNEPTKMERVVTAALDSMQTREQHAGKKPTGPSGYEFSNQDTSMDTPVEIMTASREELQLAGFSYKAAANVQKYIQAGGVLRNEKDVLKIYGMDTMQWNKAKAWIRFPEARRDSTAERWKNPNKNLVRTIIDLNTTTAEDMEKLPGIGSVLAGRIITFRDNLGGFVSVQQLKECYGLPPETYNAIQSQLTITQPAKLIYINRVDANSVTHPYLPRKMLRILDAYRKQHGVLTSPSDLRKIYPPDTSWCERLMPYIVFD